MFGVPADEGFVDRKLDEGFDHLIFGLPPAKEETILPCWIPTLRSRGKKDREGLMELKCLRL
jgi:hypothetical protein